ncbi:hypothetical protein [Novosphingobium sp. Leaf2]|uniref:hypothetical protein n=1 Tax=Novosphingobium sp. Leaf2 TaxID=1735670 RepID=UPI0006FB3DF1|nr:hypothetical protein [Novosphingobium sp. Leaf2]KQM19608.1 hypothetical protein ASE49_05165 [Novosphingobium sp. Leaf2]
MKILNSFGKKLALGAALTASVLAAASPAQAQRWYGHSYHRGGDGAAIPVGAGVLGLAVGAALADRSDRYYYDRDRWESRRYVTVVDRPGYYYYYDGYPGRYYQDRYYDRYYAPYYRERWGRPGWRDGGWGRGPGWRGDRHWRGEGRYHRDWRR